MAPDMMYKVTTQDHRLLLPLLLLSLGSPLPFPLLPGLAGPLGSVLQMAEEGMEGMEAAGMAGDAAMGAADMAMMGR